MAEQKKPVPAELPAFYDQRPPRRWPWLVAVLLVVLAVLTLVTLLRPPAFVAAVLPWGTPSPVVPAPAATPSGTPSPVTDGQAGFTLADAGATVVYAQSEDAVQRIDLGAGTAVVVPTPAQRQASDLVAGSGWAMSKGVGSGTGVLVRDGGAAQVLPVPVQQAGRLYAGGPDRVWAVPQYPTENLRSAVQLGVAGNQVSDTTIDLRGDLGLPVGSTRDALVARTDEGSYEAGPDGTRRVSAGVLLGLGTDAVLSWDCDAQQRCDARLNVPGKAPAYFPAARKSLEGLFRGTVRSTPEGVGVLSPDRRWVAIRLPEPTRSGASMVLVDLSSGRRVEVPGVLPTDGGDPAVWSASSRYVLAVTDGRLRAADRLSGKVVTLTDAQPGLRRLAVSPPAG